MWIFVYNSLTLKHHKSQPLEIYLENQPKARNPRSILLRNDRHNFVERIIVWKHSILVLIVPYKRVIDKLFQYTW